MLSLALYGGTFDPIHLGHLNTAIAIQQTFHFDMFKFLPCHIPALKAQATAEAKDRVAMLKLALSEQDEKYFFELDDSELKRDNISYTIDSLRHFRKQYGKNYALSFIMGEDSFGQLPLWKDFSQLLEFAHLLIIHRAESTEPYCHPAIQQLLQQHETKDKTQLKQTSHGFIYRFNAGTYAISSSQIKKLLAEGKTVSSLLSAKVADYIAGHDLYKADKLPNI